MRSTLACAFLFCTMVLAAAPGGAVPCSPLVGQRVVLASNDYDPDVLLWDSRQRLMDYAAGNWDVAKVLLPHALLSRPGTEALVVTCQVNVVRPKYRLAPMDAAGVKIISGPYKGRYFWILADDLHMRVHARRK